MNFMDYDFLDNNSEEKRLEEMIQRAGRVAAKEALKIKMLEYKMDFGTVVTKVKMSLN